MCNLNQYNNNRAIIGYNTNLTAVLLFLIFKTIFIDKKKKPRKL